ncbi:trichothecene 15-o-acetyltransferase, partial [Colletotrichum incanum]
LNSAPPVEMSTLRPADATLPPTSLQAHDYQWRQANAIDLPRSWVRTAVGAEAWLGLRESLSRGQYTSYISTTLRIQSTGTSLAYLEYRFARALIHLRFHHPELACRVVRLPAYDYPGCPPEVAYTIARDANSISNWATGTIHRAVAHHNGLEHTSVITKDSKKNSLPLSSVKILVPENRQSQATELAVGTCVDVVFAFHPVLWDGVSSRVFVGDLLRCAGELWSEGAPKLNAFQQYDWGTETDNLIGSILDACRADISTIGSDFTRKRDECNRMLHEGASGWGVPINDTEGDPRTIRRSLTIDQSKAVKQVVKQHLGPDYTPTHLGHAAMILALLHLNPKPSDFPSSAAVVSPLLVNGRRYLKGKDNDRRYGSCLATAFVDFAPLCQQVVDEGDKEAVKVSLKKLCRHIKEAYSKFLADDFQLAIDQDRWDKLASETESEPSPFPTTSFPVFVSDGVVDKYLPDSICNKAGKQMMTIEKCLFHLDTYDSDVMVRMESWREATTISVSFNTGKLDFNIAQQFLGEMASFMLKILP